VEFDAVDDEDIETSKLILVGSVIFVLEELGIDESSVECTLVMGKYCNSFSNSNFINFNFPLSGVPFVRVFKIKKW
jgi:hypothetical protein